MNLKAEIVSINNEINKIIQHINMLSYNQGLQEQTVAPLKEVLSECYDQKNTIEASIFINADKSFDMQKWEQDMLIAEQAVNKAFVNFNKANNILEFIESNLDQSTEQVKELKTEKENLIAQHTVTTYFEELTGVKWIENPKYGNHRLASVTFSKETAERLADLINRIAEHNYAGIAKSPRGEIYRVFMNKEAVIEDSLKVTRGQGFLWSVFQSFDENIVEQAFTPMSSEDEITAANPPAKRKFR